MAKKYISHYINGVRYIAEVQPIWQRILYWLIAVAYAIGVCYLYWNQ